MNEEKPSWGKVIGAFFLFGCLTVGACIITSAALASSMGFSGYSRGGFAGFIVEFACAAYYRSTGKLAGPAVVAAVLGAIIGVVAVQVGLALIR